MEEIYDFIEVLENERFWLIGFDKVKDMHYEGTL